MSLITTKDKSSGTHIGESIVKSSGCEKVLGIKIYKNFIFDDHV